MQIPCFIQSPILTPYVWILSNDLDFSEPNFVTKIPYFRSSKGPNKTCFLIRELQMRKIFHWHYVLTLIWYLEHEPKVGSSKNFCPLWGNYAPWRIKVIWRYMLRSIVQVMVFDLSFSFSILILFWKMAGCLYDPSQARIDFSFWTFFVCLPLWDCTFG